MIWMEPPKADTWDGELRLCTKIFATGGRKELLAFARKCGYKYPAFARVGQPDEYIKMPGHHMVERVRDKGAVEASSVRKFRKMRKELNAKS